MNDVDVTTRATRMDVWSAPQRVAELGSSGKDSASTPAAAGRLMAMTRNGVDLYLASRPDPARPWSAPVPIVELNTMSTEAVPFLDESGTVLYFASDRGGGGRAVYVSTRRAVGDTFGIATLVGELDSVAEDTDPWLSVDLRHIFFASARTGDLELYEASR